MKQSGRPLSPHLSIYRWPITMVLSILHRVTGIGLSLGLLAFTGWLMAVSSGEGYYGTLADLFDSFVGRLLLVGWTAAFFLHFANGIRHLVWDAGRGFEPSQANASGWFVVALTIVLTLAFWWLL